MKKPSPALVVFLWLASISATAQTIQVDITPAHSTNHFIPNETLGAGVDRIAAEAIDKDLVEPNLSRTLASGWQPVTYRQNTELAVEDTMGMADPDGPTLHSTQAAGKDASFELPAASVVVVRGRIGGK